MYGAFEQSLCCIATESREDVAARSQHLRYDERLSNEPIALEESGTDDITPTILSRVSSMTDDV